MGKINCLIKDTNVFENLKTEILAFSKELIDKKGSAKVNDVYRVMKDEGYEIDRESFGIAYDKAFELVDVEDREGYISQEDEIEEWGGLAYTNSLKKAVKKNLVGEDKIGELSPSQAVVSRIADLFGGKTNNLRTKTIQRQMQDIMLKWANNVQTQRGETQKKDKKDAIKVIEEFFDFENVGIQTIQGTLNNLDILRQDILKSKNDVVLSIRERTDISDEEKNDLENEYSEFVKPFINAINDIVLSSNESQQLINKVLGNSDLLDASGENFVNKNGNISWNKVGGESGNVQFVRGAFRSLLDKGKILNEDGKPLILTESQKDILEQHFANVYEAKRDAVIANRVANAQRLADEKAKRMEKPPQASASKKSSGITVTKLISDFMSGLGNFTISKDAKGNTITKTDWDNVKEELKKSLANGDKSTVNELVKKFENYLKKLYPTSTEEQRKYAVDKFKDRLENAIKGKEIRRSAIDKFAKLVDLQGGKAFEVDTNQAVLKLLNVESLDKQSMIQLNKLATFLNNLSDKNGFSSNYVRTANIVNYQIRKIISASNEKKVNIGGVISRVVEAWLRSGQSLMLFTGQGLSENVLTAYFNNLMTSFRLGGVTKGQSLASAKASIDALSSFAQTSIDSTSSESGRLGNVNVVNSISTSERYNVNQILHYFKDVYDKIKNKDFKGLKSTKALEQIATLIPSVTNTLARIGLSAPDSAFTNSMLGKNMLLTVYDMLEKSHGKDVAMKAVKGMRGYKNNKILQDKFKDLFNTQYNQAISETEALLGKKLTAMEKRSLANDIRDNLTEYVLQDVSGGVISKKEAEVIVRVAIHSASNVAQRFHGKQSLDIGGIGTANLIVMPTTVGITSALNKYLSNQENRIKEGKINSAMANKMIGAFLSIKYASFMTGIGRFLTLGLKTSVLSTFTDKGGIAMREADKNSEGLISSLSENPKNILKIDENDLIKYFSASQQRKQLWSRAIGNVIISTTFALLLNAILKSGDDDDDDWKDSVRVFYETMMESRMGRLILQRMLTIDMGLMAFISNVFYGSDAKKGAGYALEYVGNAMTIEGGETLLERGTKSIDYLKKSDNDTEGVGDAIAPIVMDKLMTPYDINIAEKFYKVAQTIKEAKEGKTDIADRIKELNKEMYKHSEKEGWSYFADVSTRRGLINTLTRWNENRKEKGEVTPFMNRLKEK